MIEGSIDANLLAELENKIGYKFNDKELLIRALTHRSYGNENKLFHNMSYERLEFLGDSLLGFVTADYLYKYSPELKEGMMSKYKAKLVCEDALSATASRLSIGKYLLMSKGTFMTGGRENNSILADVVEAICAAIYLDSNIDNAVKFLYENVLNNFLINEIEEDSKSRLQELLAADLKTPSYKLLSQTGPDHKKSFEMAVFVDNVELGRGVGFSKKEAQMCAAKAALEKYNRVGENDVFKSYRDTRL